jgi:hypothetical protein
MAAAMADTLCSPELEHTLYILSKKRSLDGEFIWAVFLYQAKYFLMDELKAFVVIFLSR